MSDSAIKIGFVRSSRTAKIILAPAGVTQSIQRFPQVGVRFYIVESDSDAAIGIKTDKTQQELFTVGTGKEFSEDQAFTALEFENFSAAQITLTVFMGYGNFIDQRTTIVGNRLTSILPTIEPKTAMVAGVVNSINAITAFTLTGVPSTLQLRRKAIGVTNLDPNLNLQLRDALLNIGLTIFPGTSIIYPLSESVQIYNPNGAAVALSYNEVWWLKP